MSHRIRPASRLAGMLLALCAGGALAACDDDRPAPVMETAPPEPAPLAVEAPPPPQPSGMPVAEPVAPAQAPSAMQTTEVAPGGGGGETLEARRAQEQTMINLTGSPTGASTTRGGGAVPQQPAGWMFWMPAPSTSTVTPPATGPGSTVTPTPTPPSQLGIGVPSAALPGPGAVNVAPAASGGPATTGGIVDDGAIVPSTPT
jgi:hypothetical protein